LRFLNRKKEKADLGFRIAEGKHFGFRIADFGLGWRGKEHFGCRIVDLRLRRAVKSRKEWSRVVKGG